MGRTKEFNGFETGEGSDDADDDNDDDDVSVEVPWNIFAVQIWALLGCVRGCADHRVQN